MSRLDASGATVRLERLSRAYGDVLALDQLSLSVEAGEFFTFLGPSGSGKTTTLMLIAGFTEPTGGEVYIDERALSGVPPHQRNIGVVFQNYSLFPHMSVAENVAFPLQLRGEDDTTIERRVEAMLERVQLQMLANQMPHELSGGQQQRVALARALVFEPRVLLLDEPLSALDQSLRAQMQIELKNLHRELGTTIICVTHDQSEALALSDRIAVLHEGRLEQVGTPRLLYERPESRFVAAFIGESNVLDGRIIDIKGEDVHISLGEDEEVHARPHQELIPGSKCEILIRPHHVQVGNTGLGLKNTYQASIRTTIYGGDSLKVEIALAGGQTLLAWIPNGQAPATELAPGTTVTVGFASEHALVYPVSEPVKRGLRS